MQSELFALPAPAPVLVDDFQCGHDASLDQYATPEYFAELLVDSLRIRHGERVVDIGCGRGAFLKAVPKHAKAVGIEIDAAMAEYAVKNTGRPVIIGDFKTVELPFEPTLFVGNPPFTKAEFDQWLKIMHKHLKEGEGRAACILPSYHFQWSRPVLEWHEMFSIEQHIIPREIFPNLMKPLNWVIFTKERIRKLTGFLFYPQVAETKDLPKDVKLLLVHGTPGKSVWRAVVDAAIEARGGSAKLAEIYDFVSGQRPTENKHWHAQVRKVLYTGPYSRTDDASWDKAA